MCVDMMGGGGKTPDDEYDDIQSQFNYIFPDKTIDYEREVNPHDLKNKPLDFYVYDYGGLLPGCDGLLESNMRELIQQAKDHPNAMFVIYSTFTIPWYKDLIQDDLPEDRPRNIYLMGTEKKLIEACQLWLEAGLIKEQGAY